METSKWYYIKRITAWLEILSFKDIKRLYYLTQRLWVKDTAEG